MNLRVPKMRGISSLAAEPVSFSRRTLLHGVSKYLSIHYIDPREDYYRDIWSKHVASKLYL